MIVDSWWVVGGAAASAALVYGVGAVLAKPKLVAPATTSDPYKLAYLGGGQSRVVYAALAQLRVAGVIEATNDGLIRATAPVPHGATLTEREVYAAIADKQVTRSQLLFTTRITTPSVELPASRRSALVPGLIMAGLAVVFWVLTVQRLTAAGSNDSMGTAMSLIAIAASLSVPQFIRRIGAKGDPLALARSRHAAPTADQPALSVALHGPESIWVIDREFAWKADIPAPGRRAAAGRDRGSPDYEWSAGDSSDGGAGDGSSD